MDFMTLAADRYSVRKFKDTPVEQEAINKILQAAALSPTACNNQPQKIFVLRSKEALEKLKKCTDSHFNAPLAFIVCYDKSICWKRPFDGKESGDIDASIVTTHMILEAASIGIGSTWVMYFKPDVLKEVFELPDSIVPVSVIPMGYAADDAKPAERHALYRDPGEIITTL